MVMPYNPVWVWVWCRGKERGCQQGFTLASTRMATKCGVSKAGSTYYVVENLNPNMCSKTDWHGSCLRGQRRHLLGFENCILLGGTNDHFTFCCCSSEEVHMSSFSLRGIRTWLIQQRFSRVLEFRSTRRPARLSSEEKRSI